jgi:type I restriction enzyme M protein
MLNANVKQQINTARDILVGKIPDPKGQIDQITNALIYKFMDDQDRLALTLPGGKANFFVNELKPYAWHKLFDSKLSNQDKANLYVEGIAKLSVSKHLPDLFRDIFKDAFLPFRAPDTIAMFLGEINKFDYHHSEDLGNAFEYLLSIMGSQGDAGQFRTPRNVIEFIVDAVDPSKDDYILDPACGTAGFLVEAYNHITKDKKLTPNEIQELAQHIHGVDIDPGMAKIARVNLYLHGFKTPLITEDDTLSDERLWGKKYDVILANPPFMTPKGGIVPHDKFSVKSNRAEVLFTDYIAEHLKLAGRAGVVVPEGIIFQSGKVYKQLRKMLVDDNYLWAVISLPAGVFNPYSGVKTSILLFDRERSAKNTEILFFKVHNDGFDLGAQRREITKNDLPEALEILKKWKDNEKVENSKAIYIEKTKIAESDDYNLSIDRYRVATDYSNAKWPMVELGEVCNVLNGYAFKSNLFNNQKIGVPVIRIRDVNSGFSETYYSGKYDEKYVINNGDLLIGMDGDFFATLWKHGTALLNQRVCRLENFKGADKKYIHFLIQKELSTIQEATYAVTVKHLSSSQIEKIKIPFPPLEIQEQIVAELEGYAGIIAGAKQITQNWKPKIDIDPEWEKVKLGEVANFTMGGTPPQSEINSKNANIPWVKGSDLSKGYIYETENFISDKGMKNSRARYYEVGTILVGRTGQGKTRGTVSVLKIKATTNETMIGVFPDSNKVNSEYLYNYLISQYKKFREIGGDNQRGGITQQDLDKFMIVLPTLKTQAQIVEKIEAERALVESAKKLLDIYDQKTKDAIAKLWEE